MTSVNLSTQADVPPPPWHLRGEAVAFFGGPMTLRLLVHYTQSPVGPYDEHALATWNLRGPHVFQMSVNSPASRRGGRLNWGFPKVLETLEWQQSGSRLTFVREGQVFRVRGVGPRFPLALPFWTAQRHGGKWVRVPGTVRGWAQLAWRGRQLALWLHDFQLEIGPPF